MGKGGRWTERKGGDRVEERGRGGRWTERERREFKDGLTEMGIGCGLEKKDGCGLQTPRLDHVHLA